MRLDKASLSWMRLVALLGLGLTGSGIFVFHPRASAAPSLTTAPSDLIVRSIDVRYTGEPAGNAKELISKMHTRVGEPYSEKTLDGDIRDLPTIHHIPIERIFGVPAADGGVTIIVVVRTSGTNLGAQSADGARARKNREENFNPYEPDDETSGSKSPSFDRNPFRMGRPFHPPQVEPLLSGKKANSLTLDDPFNYRKVRVDYGVPLQVGPVVDETVLVADIDSGELAATVNDQPITVAEVTNATAPKDRQSAEARKTSLEKLIDDALVLQEAKKHGYTVPENFIQERITAIVDDTFHGNRAAFEATLHKQGLTVEKFEQFQWNQIMLQSMKHEIAKSGTDAAAKRQAVADWLTAARASATIVYK